ncbi:MAG: sugar phosphate isomerase/epimerase [Lentisphaeria bacterium]|nr:sugar phosphate isomerase/epimerase [Lentisphaeria bacterium]
MKVHFLFGKSESAPEELAAMKAAGFDFAEASVSTILIPAEGAEAWAVQKQKLLEAQKILQYKSLNGFLPGTFKLTGPAPTTEAALAYAETACRRADEVGIPYLVLGSSAARSVPEGYDLEAGKAQFVEYCRELCRRIADCKVRILLENLQRKESNILNSLKDSLAVMKAADSPRLQLMADCFHMYQVGDSPELLKEVGEHLFHIHFADPETRKLPGFSKSTYLLECMKVLAEMKYQGAISMECSWIEKNSSFEESWRDGLRVVHQWMAEC